MGCIEYTERVASGPQNPPGPNVPMAQQLFGRSNSIE